MLPNDASGPKRDQKAEHNISRQGEEQILMHIRV